MKVEVAVLVSPVPNSPYCLRSKATFNETVHRAQELCESREGRPGLPVLNSPYGLCGREATLNLNWPFLNVGQSWIRAQKFFPFSPPHDSELAVSEAGTTC